MMSLLFKASTGGSRARLSCVVSVLLLFFATLITTVRAEEIITSFHADIQVEKNGDLIVTETISVISEGREIRRGIFRDFPRSFLDDDGYLKRVSFDILSVKRNGKDEPYSTSYYNSDSRVRIGEEDVFIDRGEHTYELTYRTDRQIRYFDGHDEVYWNVTGTGWSFPIDKASAEVTLPEGGRFDGTDYFTGYFDEAEKNARAAIVDGGRKAVFETTAPLAAQQGLTIVATMPSGTIGLPSASQAFWWYLRDYGHLIFGALTLGLIALYYVIAWFKSGRDPDGGTIIPRWDVPEGVSPALAGYISSRESISGKNALTAAILSLAVKGCLAINKTGKTPVLVPIADTETDDLPVGEKAVLKVLSTREDFPLSKRNASSVAKLNRAFNRAIEGEHRGRFYKHNRRWVVLGILLSLAGVVLSALFNITSMIILIIGLVICLFAGAFLVPVYLLGRASANSEDTARKVLGLFLAGALAGLILYGVVWLVQLLVEQSQSPGVTLFIVLIAGIVAINLWFFKIMGAPTPLGAELMNAIKGLQLYLNVAEKERMNLVGAPDMSPRHFETLLPYAVALGLEKPWSETFSNWLKSVGPESSDTGGYRPAWDRGSMFDDFSSGRHMSGIGASLSGSITSSMPAPSSSSSGTSGGSSGGGGGGGGGGGW